MNLTEDAYGMPTGMLLHEAGRQFAMAEIVRDSLQQGLYERGGWFLLLVWAERTCGVPGAGDQTIPRQTPMAAAGGNPLPAERLNEPLCPGPVRCPDPFAARLDQDCRVCGGRDPLPF